MPDLQLRDVPAEVIERLTRLAEREHASVDAVAIGALSAVGQCGGNSKLLAVLPDTGIALDEIVDAVRAGR